MSALERQALKSKIGGLPPMPPSGVGGGVSKRNLMRKKDYTAVHWDKYFDQKHDVQVGESTFRLYECGTSGPVLLFLHGGGFSALSWSLVSSTLCQLVTCRCAALDLRGHGDTVSNDDGDLCAETLSSDVGDVVKSLYGDEPPPIILIGHSMGGAIAVHTAERKLIPSIIGLVVIDVVEGTAMESLNSMQSFLRGRPSTFKSLEHAIEWSVRSGQIRNLESAKVSMVGQIKRLDTQETATSEMEQDCGLELSTSGSRVGDAIQEEDEDGETTSPAESQQSSSSDHFRTPKPTTENSSQYTWRIDLGKTEKYWKGWFQGLSQRFLSCEVPKMLVLAGVDRLDKDLTIGQMQGKFQMQVLPQSGHAVHEDVPDKVADILATFMVRYKVAEPRDSFQRSFPAC
ncbi:protein phosphatase methylesterase 1-like isoform X2 [Ylistrum balloti]|uniref:protein phosphatase methylesterase 1-like isoform X2 n=1 Tax=Ylistrum balloti TaxID=509963 RepID=UPI002905C593|nr:protein phosphatase methylesterase 1-like isoform X2 [Ylistrum balloti]